MNQLAIKQEPGQRPDARPTQKLTEIVYDAAPPGDVLEAAGVCSDDLSYISFGGITSRPTVVLETTSLRAFDILTELRSRYPHMMRQTSDEDQLTSIVYDPLPPQHLIEAAGIDPNCLCCYVEGAIMHRPQVVVRVPVQYAQPLRSLIQRYASGVEIQERPASGIRMDDDGIIYDLDSMNHGVGF
ncbi:TPA: hypothetical protein HA265_08195 [Candidatus Woesearchaeota archaeon]|nr:hypothetical protein [Candidatus Woesearchaeota archaeon]